MESIAFGSRLILESLAENGSPVNQIYACGGATHSDLFMQIYADICGIPISVVKVADAPLVGDAVLAFTGMGVYADLAEAAEAMVRFDRHYRPNAELGQEYQFYFELYKDTYHQLKGLMHRLSNHLQESKGIKASLAIAQHLVRKVDSNTLFNLRPSPLRVHHGRRKVGIKKPSEGDSIL